MTASKKPFWSIGEFYNQAWETTWKHKKLWIVGLAVSLYAAGGGQDFNFNNSSSSTSEQSSKYEQSTELPTSPYQEMTAEESSEAAMMVETENPEIPTELMPEGFEQAGAFISGFEALFSGTDSPLVEGFQAVSGGVWAAMVLQVIMFALFMFVFGIALRAWAEGTMVKAYGQAAEEDKVDLYASSSFAITKIKSLVWLMFVPFLKLFLISIVVLAVGGIILAIIAQLAEGLGVLAGLVAFGAVLYFIYKVIRLSVALIYGVRYAVLEDMSGSESFAQAYDLSKGNIWKTLRLGIANAIVVGLVSLILLIPAAGVGIATIVPSIMNQSFTVWTVVPLVVVGLLTMLVMALVGAIMTVFTYGTWHHAYRVLTQLRKEEVAA